jgi:hypothetical protein
MRPSFVVSCAVYYYLQLLRYGLNTTRQCSIEMHKTLCYRSHVKDKHIIAQWDIYVYLLYTAILLICAARQKSCYFPKYLTIYLPF